MPVYNPANEGSELKYKYINSSIPAGNTVSSALVANPETLFTTTTNIPSTAFAAGGSRVLINCSGILSTGVLSLPLTVRIKSGSNVLAAVSVTPALNLTNSGWSMELECNVFDLNTVDIQGKASFSTTFMTIGNTATFAVNMANDVPISVSAQWGALALGGGITLRNFSVIVF